MCDGYHRASQCNYPPLVERCASCGSMKFGKDHKCIIKAGGYRMIVQGHKLNAKFKIKLDYFNDFYYFSCINGNFEPIDTNLMSPATHGIFSVQDKILTYESTKFVRFAFYVIMLQHGVSPVATLRGVTVNDQGVVLNKCHVVLSEILGKFRMHTALILGIQGNSMNRDLVNLKFSPKSPSKSAEWTVEAGWMITQNPVDSVISNPCN